LVKVQSIVFQTNEIFKNEKGCRLVKKSMDGQNGFKKNKKMIVFENERNRNKTNDLKFSKTKSKKRTYDFIEWTVLLNICSVRKRKNRWKMNDNFENERNQFF